MITILGGSDYCGFYIIDSGLADEDWYLRVEEWEINPICNKTSGGICLHTSDKAVLYALVFEILSEKPTIDEFTEWDEVAESSIKVDSETLLVFTVPEGLDDLHGSIPLNSGSYVLRIHFKSRDEIFKDMKVHKDMTDDDLYDIEDIFYIQAWLGDLIPTKVLYCRE